MEEKNVPHSGMNLRGFFRIQIEDGPTGKIVGDSGWHENQVTNQGVLKFLVFTLGNSSGSSQIGYVALGTGGAPAAADVVLAGEISGSTKRTAVTFSSVNSHTAQFVATFSSGASFLAGNSNLSNIGLFAATTTNATLFAGNTYDSSSCGTNQNVNVTYQIRFATT